VDTDTILGGIGTLTGMISLVWHIVRSRHDRCEFRLSEFKITYLAVPPGWRYSELLGRGATPAAPAPVGTWVHFSGRLINKGYQPGSVERIRCSLARVPDNGEGAFPEGELRMPIHVEAHGSRDISFRHHLNTDHTAVDRVPKKVKCVIILEDQAGRRHRTSFFATREESPQFSVVRRSH
jgi:hypothetical protein